MLIIALIALALARPFLTLGLPLAAVRAKTDVVIVLDNSYSMAYQDVDGVWFEKAKTIATDILQSLRHGDSASLILMSDIPKAIYQKLTPDVNAVITSLRDSHVSYRSTNVQTSIELAHEILAESKNQNKELYLISDFAKNGWENWGQIQNLSGSRIFLLPVNEKGAHNTNIEEILLSHQLIGVELPFYLNVKVKNNSIAPITQTTLSMYTENKKRKTQTFSGSANETILNTITHTFSTPGLHTGYFELTPDRLNIDNRRYYVLDVIGDIRILCVSANNDFILLALDPMFNMQNVSANIRTPMIQPIACTISEFENYPLQGIDIILLADLPTISENTNVKLQEFIRQGKDIINFVSHPQKLTWAPAEYEQSMNWNVPQRIVQYDETHPIFEIFDENVLSGQYGPQFYQGFTVNPVSDANIIATFGDGTPFLIERREGKSRILFYNATLQQNLKHNELLINPYFLPLIQNSVLYAVNDDTKRNIIVGESFNASYSDHIGAPAWIKRFDSSDDGSSTAIPINDDGTLQFNSTEYPGIYQVEIQKSNRTDRDFFAVNTPKSESNLELIPLNVASQRINAQLNTTNKNGELDTEALDISRHGREIWGELLIISVGLLLLEGYLSNRQSTLSSRTI